MSRVTPDKFGNEGCHDRYESGNWEKLMTLQDLPSILETVRKLDNKTFEYLMLAKQKYNEAKS